MPRKHKRKISLIPHSRVSREFHLEVYRHRITGHSPVEISRILGSSLPTVRRSIGKTREAFFASGERSATIFRATMEKMKIVDHEAYYHILGQLGYFYVERYGFDLFDYFRCFAQCPTRIPLRKFVPKHLEVHSYTGRSYQLKVTTQNDVNFCQEYFMKADSCRFCKLRPVIGKVYEPYATSTRIYFDMLYFISLHRLREPTQDKIVELLDGAIVYSMTVSILMEILARGSRDGMNEHEAIERMENYFLDFTNFLWEEIN